MFVVFKLESAYFLSNSKELNIENTRQRKTTHNPKNIKMISIFGILVVLFLIVAGLHDTNLYLWGLWFHLFFFFDQNKPVLFPTQMGCVQCARENDVFMHCHCRFICFVALHTYGIIIQLSSILLNPLIQRTNRTTPTITLIALQSIISQWKTFVERDVRFCKDGMLISLFVCLSGLRKFSFYHVWYVHRPRLDESKYFAEKIHHQQQQQL